MTEIKTAQAWKCKTFPLRAGVLGEHLIDGDDEPVVIVQGMTEAEIHEAAALRSACRELGIETVEQLKTRLAPDKDYTFLLSIIHWAITFWDAVPNDTLMHYTPLPKGIDLDYLRDLVKGVKYPPKLADDSPVAPDPRVAELSGYITVLLDLATDAANGLEYVRDVHGDLYGVGFDRVKIKAEVLPVIRLKMTQLIAAQRGEVEG